MTVYYNEHDPRAAAWLRELIRAGLIAKGHVDERDIRLVRPADLHGFRQCHFFAGIGGWSYALRLAGWPDTQPVWTGSCPCQPFSLAGKRMGTADTRHLWPQFRRLIRKCRPPVVFGEQVANSDGRKWLAAVFADLEALGYPTAGADLCAAGVGAPHIRQRLYWVGVSYRNGRESRWPTTPPYGHRGAIESTGGIGHVADDGSSGLEKYREQPAREEPQAAQRGGTADIMGDPGSSGGWRNSDTVLGAEAKGGSERQAVGSVANVSESSSFWSDCDWVPCRDGKWRPVEPGTFPLAHGIPGRVGLLRGYGNAIVPQVAAKFVQAYMQC